MSSVRPIVQAQTREVSAHRTQVNEQDIRVAIHGAHKAVTGQAPSRALLDTLVAHASLETASGAQMFNYNFGGIKGTSPSGLTTRYGTREVFDGKEVHITDSFRAYGSLEEGARDYISLMRARYGEAMRVAESGDMAAFAHALKKSHYYTASEREYANALSRLSGRPVTEASFRDAPDRAEDFSSTELLSRVMDALSSSTARIASPLEKESSM